LNYWDERQQSWKPSQEIIEPIPGGAIARQGGQQVKFASDLNVEGSIKILGSDGETIRASVIGLVYRGLKSDRKVVLGKVRSTRGEIVPPNRVVYRDAFDGVRADVLYIYKKSGVVQDVIIRERVGTPESYGFAEGEPVALEVVTEFFDAPNPQRSIRVSRESEAAEARAGRASRLQDEELSFGAIRFADGVAFPTQTNPGDVSQVINVSKRWHSVGGRDFLMEAVPYQSIKNQVEVLINSSQARLQNSGMWVSVSDVFERNLEESVNSSVPLEVTTIDPLATAGFVIDYTTITSNVSNYRFQSGTTYLISGGQFYAQLTTVFEGGCVIKLKSGRLACNGRINFETTACEPAIFTSWLDDSVGQTIAGSSGDPTGPPYASQGLLLTDHLPSVVKHARFTYLGEAVIFRNGGGPESDKLEDVTMLHNSYGTYTIGGALTHK